MFSGIFTICSKVCYSLIDLVAISSYNDLFSDGKFDMKLVVTTTCWGVYSVCDTILANRACWDCTILSNDCKKSSNLVEFIILYFDVIKGMYWFETCYVNIDYHT